MSSRWTVSLLVILNALPSSQLCVTYSAYSLTFRSHPLSFYLSIYLSPTSCLLRYSAPYPAAVSQPSLHYSAPQFPSPHPHPLHTMLSFSIKSSGIHVVLDQAYFVDNS